MNVNDKLTLSLLQVKKRYTNPRNFSFEELYHQDLVFSLALLWLAVLVNIFNKAQSSNQNHRLIKS